jgi:hypothetical protein
MPASAEHREGGKMHLPGNLCRNYMD